jgi:succinoglycan biosynthesis transport protein ExoP
MFDPERPGDRKPERSLLSLARRQERPVAPSFDGFASGDTDPQALHRAARLRREAKPNPLLRALAANEQRQDSPGMFDGEPASPAWRDDTPAGQGAAASQAASEQRGGRRSDEQWRPLFDPAKIVAGVVKSRYLILSTTILGAALGVMIAMSTPKTYTSVTDIQIDPRDIKVFDRNLTEGGLPSDATLAIIENQVRVITSSTVIDKVVDQLNLQADPEFNGSQQSFGISSLIGDLRSIMSRSEPSGGERRSALAKQKLYDGLRVERAGKTFIVSIAMTTQDRQKSALIANTIANVFMTSYAGLQSDTAGKASEELTARLAELQREVEAAERKVEAFQAEHELIDAKGGLISDDELIRLNDQLTIARARTLELNARASTARELDLNSVVDGGLPEQITSSVISDLRSQYSAARQTLDRAAVRLGPRHPQRQAAEAEVAGVRDQISAELHRLVSSIQVELKRAVQLEQDLAIRLAQLKARQGNVGENLVDLRELEREASAKRAVYENFLLRARETGEQSGINTANVSVISAAQPPLDSNGPSRALITIAGLLLGFLAGIGLGVMRGAWDSLRTPRPEDAGPPRRTAGSRRRLGVIKRPASPSSSSARTPPARSMSRPSRKGQGVRLPFGAAHAAGGYLRGRPALALIAELNADPAIHGILVQLPLPLHIDSERSSRRSRRTRMSTAFTSSMSASSAPATSNGASCPARRPAR